MSIFPKLTSENLVLICFEFEFVVLGWENIELFSIWFQQKRLFAKKKMGQVVLVFVWRVHWVKITAVKVECFSDGREKTVVFSFCCYDVLYKCIKIHFCPLIWNWVMSIDDSTNYEASQFCLKFEFWMVRCDWLNFEFFVGDWIPNFREQPHDCFCDQFMVCRACKHCSYFKARYYLARGWSPLSLLDISIEDS